MNMEPIDIIILIAAVLIVGGVIAWQIIRKKKGKVGCCDCSSCDGCCSCKAKEEPKDGPQ